MPRLNIDQRNEAIGMLNSGVRQERVAEHFHVHQSTVSRLQNRYRATGRVRDLPRTAAQRLTSTRQGRYVVASYLRNRFRTARETARAIVGRKGRRELCERVLRRRLAARSLRCRRPSRRQIMAHQQRLALRRWATALDCDGKPRLEILEQPRQRGQRFRYECEGRSAGSILGENSTEQHKTYTAVQVLNYAGRVRLVMSLLTHEPPFRPHPHSLVGKNCEDGVCILELDPPNLYVQFQNLGIQCVKRKHVFDAIKQRLIRRIDPYNVGERALKMENLHMNAVRLCWQAYLLDNHGNVLRALPPVLSNPIYDKKGTNTSELRISRLNINHGSVAGGDECFILCDKVQKEDIEVVFSHGSWTELADLSQTDVHRQVAIVFRTPPFYQRDITAPVHVCMQLRRPSDRVVSEAVSFFYTPLDSDPHQLVVKRRRKPLYNLMKSPYHKEVENKDSSRWESNGGMDTAKHRLKIKLQQRELEMRTTLTNKASVAIADPYNSTQPCEDWEASTSSTMVFHPQTSHYIPPSALASGSSWEGSCEGDLLPGMPQEGEAILNRALTVIDDALCRYDGTFMPPMEGYIDQIHSGTAHVQTMHSALPSEPGGSHQGIIPFSGLGVADWGNNYETNSCEVPFKRPAGAYGTTF